MTHEEAIKMVLTKCALGYPNFVPTEGILDEYAEEFAETNVHDFAVALKAARTRSRFFPTIADVWKELGATEPKPNAGEGSAHRAEYIAQDAIESRRLLGGPVSTGAGSPGFTPEVRAALDALYEKGERLKEGKVGGKYRTTPEEREVIELRHKMITAQLEDMARYDSDTAKANAAKLMEDMK